MQTAQPNWKLLANMGDVNPIDYGGYFIFTDETGVYPAEAELLIAPDDDNGEWLAYRFILERCTFTNGILSDNRFHPDIPAWFADPESERANRPQDSTYLSNVAQFIGMDNPLELADMLCSACLLKRAEAYRAIGEYHGFDNFNSDPLVMTRAEAESRYANHVI